jgi:hypothetical protein
MANELVPRPEWLADIDNTFFLQLGYILTFSPPGGTDMLVGFKPTSMGYDGCTADEIEVNTFYSLDNFKKFIPTMIDGGNVTIQGLFDPRFPMPKFASTRQSRTQGMAGTLICGVTDSSITSGQMAVVFKGPANVTNWGGMENTETGGLIHRSFTFHFSGEPTFNTVTFPGVTS